MLAPSLLALALAAPAPTYCAPGAATRQLEEGRKIQRERAEGGADDAIAAYRKALELDPSCASALWELGWSYQVKGDWAKVIESWDALRKLKPDHPELDAQYPQALARRDQAASLGKLPDPGKLPPPDEAPSEGPRITVAAVGDVTMGKAWPPGGERLPPDGARAFFEHVKPLLSRTDITFGNLETVLADRGDSTKCGKKSTNCYAFRIPTAYGQVLRDAGFDVMSVANNHAGDFGPSGRKSTIAALDAAGIHHSGLVGDIARWETKGVKFAMIAFSFGSDVYRVQELETARRLVAEVDRTADVVVVSFHAGAEGKGADHVTRKTEIAFGENRGDPYAFAHAMVDAGADLLLGHGPHVFRAMEVYEGRFIAYSLGNFSSWSLFSIKGAGGVSGVLEVTIAPNGVATEAVLHPTFLDDPGVPKPDPQKRVIERVRSLSKADFGAELLDADGRWKRP